MLNTEPDRDQPVDAPIRLAGGALTIAGIASLIVCGIWFAFYMLVFLPRGSP